MNDEADAPRVFVGTERFEVRGTLGVGAMGVVYEAFDRRRQQLVALKTLRFRDPTLLYRLKKEFRALSEVAHPNLVKLHELHVEEERCFFTMEIVDGSSFLEYVGAPPDLERLREALAQLAAGVHALHLAGKLHRDLKPSNLLVTRDGGLKICDFGLVTAVVHDEQTRSQHTLGTPRYMSPEQAANRALDEASDWYAVGAILYEALTGRPPIDGSAFAVMRDKQLVDPVPPAELVAGVPPELDALCMALLDRVPARRPDGTQVLAQLGRAPRMGVRPMGCSFVGRERELDELKAAFEKSRASGRALEVRGEPGTGKTSLVRRFIESARAGGALVLSGRCHDGETVPLAALDGIVDALAGHLRRNPDDAGPLDAEDAAALVRVFPVLARAAPFAGVDADTAEPERALSALKALLTRLGSRPMLLFLDDVDVDDGARLALAALLAPPAPALLLVTCASGLDAPLGSPLTLGALPPDETEVLARGLLPDAPRSRPIAARIAEASGGNPRLVHLLARFATSERRPSARSISLERALEAELERLGPEARTVMRLLAVADAPLAASRIASAVTDLGVAAEPALDLLRVERLARSRRGHWQVYHPRLAAAAASGLTVAERRGLSQRLSIAR
jgi:hypothetical protein